MFWPPGDGVRGWRKEWGVKRRRSSLLMYEGSPIFWITLSMRGWGKGQIAFLVPSLRVSLKPTAVSFSLVRLAFPFDDNSLMWFLTWPVTSPLQCLWLFCLKISFSFFYKESASVGIKTIQSKKRNTHTQMRTRSHTHL